MSYIIGKNAGTIVGIIYGFFTAYGCWKFFSPENIILKIFIGLFMIVVFTGVLFAFRSWYEEEPDRQTTFDLG